MFLGQSTASSYDSLGITLCTEMNLRFVHNWEIEILRSIISYSSPNFDKRLTQRETFWFLTVTTHCCSQQFLAVSGASNPHHSLAKEQQNLSQAFPTFVFGKTQLLQKAMQNDGLQPCTSARWDHRDHLVGHGCCFSFPKRNSWRSKDHGSHGSKNATTVRTPVNPVFTLFEWFMRISPRNLQQDPLPRPLLSYVSNSNFSQLL